MTHDTITPTTTTHTDAVAATADIETAHGVREIADATALTIAAWWQSPGTIGSTLASLASGRPVDLTALLDDIHATRVESHRARTLSEFDGRALDMLATWAIRHPSRVLAAATRSAVLAFWSVLAANLPDATTGDLSPDTAARFESAASDAAAAWYAANVTTGDRS